MNLKVLKKIGVYGMLFVILSSTYTSTVIQAQSNDNHKKDGNAQQVQALEAFLGSPGYAAMETEQKLVSLFVTCLCDFKVKGHFSKFVKTLISFLENSEHVTQLKSKFPSLNIPAIITVLKKVENDKFAVQIVLKLKNYISLFPEEFANMLPAELIEMNVLVFRSRISQRLQDTL